MSSQFHAQPFREAVRSVAVGQTMPSLNTTILRGITVDLPPVEEQRVIGEVASDLNRDLDVLDGRLAKAKAVKQGMMQELLTGRTRLPVAKAAS
jgi:type I restriction enzyme S subunit